MAIHRECKQTQKKSMKERNEEKIIHTKSIRNHIIPYDCEQEFQYVSEGEQPHSPLHQIVATKS